MLRYAMTILILPLLLILPITGCNGKSANSYSSDAAKLNNQALQLMAQNDYESAITKLEAAIEANPNSFAYVANLAYALYHTGRYDDATRQYDRLIQLKPDDPSAYFDYGICRKDAGDITGALPLFLKAVELGSDSGKLPEMLYELAGCHVRLGNRAGAIATLRRLLEFEPRAEFYNKLGDLLQEDGDLEGAEKAYRDAIDLSPYFIPAMNSLALLLDTTGRKEEARILYQIIFDKDPNNAVAHNNLAMDFRDEGDIDAAILEIKFAINADPENPLYHYHYAQFLLESGQKSAAINELQKTLSLDPGFEDARDTLSSLGIR